MVRISAPFMGPGIDSQQVLEMSNFGPAPLALSPGLPCQIAGHTPACAPEHMREACNSRFGRHHLHFLDND
jgi:hypothetical protein